MNVLILTYPIYTMRIHRMVLYCVKTYSTRHTNVSKFPVKLYLYKHMNEDPVIHVWHIWWKKRFPWHPFLNMI